MQYTFTLGINKASDVVEMLLQNRFDFDVRVVEGDPRRFITIYTRQAYDRVLCLLEVV